MFVSETVFRFNLLLGKITLSELRHKGIDLYIGELVYDKGRKYTKTDSLNMPSSPTHIDCSQHSHVENQL